MRPTPTIKFIETCCWFLSECGLRVQSHQLFFFLVQCVVLGFLFMYFFQIFWFISRENSNKWDVLHRQSKDDLNKGPNLSSVFTWIFMEFYFDLLRQGSLWKLKYIRRYDCLLMGKDVLQDDPNRQGEKKTPIEHSKM